MRMKVSGMLLSSVAALALVSTSLPLGAWLSSGDVAFAQGSHGGSQGGGGRGGSGGSRGGSGGADSGHSGGSDGGALSGGSGSAGGAIGGHGAGQGGPSADSDGRGPRNQPGEGSRGTKPVWAQEGREHISMPLV